jgi:hypothetical protein
MKILLGIGLIIVGLLIFIVQIRNYYKNSYMVTTTRTNILLVGIGFVVLGIIAIVKAL